MLSSNAGPSFVIGKTNRNASIRAAILWRSDATGSCPTPVSAGPSIPPKVTLIDRDLLNYRKYRRFTKGRRAAMLRRLTRKVKINDAMLACY